MRLSRWAFRQRSDSASFPSCHLRTIWLTLEAGAVGVFVASIPITYFLQRLNYEMRWYIVTDRSLRIRSGVVWLREMTMTFANIQTIRVNANPIERWLG